MIDHKLESWVIDALVDETDIYRAKKGTIRHTSYLNFECSTCKGIFRDELFKTMRDPKCQERKALLCPRCREKLPDINSFKGFIDALCMTRKLHCVLNESTTHITFSITSLNFGVNYLLCKEGTEPNHKFTHELLNKGRKTHTKFIQIYHADWSRKKEQIRNYVTNIVDGLLLEGYAKKAALVNKVNTSVISIDDKTFENFVNKFCITDLKITQGKTIRLALLQRNPKDISAVIQITKCSGKKATANRYTLEYIANPYFNHKEASDCLFEYLTYKKMTGTYEMFTSNDLLNEHQKGWINCGNVSRQYFWYNRTSDTYMRRYEAQPANLIKCHAELVAMAQSLKTSIELYVCETLGFYRIWRGGLTLNEIYL